MGYKVRIVEEGSKYRAKANDGVHGEGNTMFPKCLRIPGAVFEVETLKWNGKNYSASGEIKRIDQ